MNAVRWSIFIVLLVAVNGRAALPVRSGQLRMVFVDEKDRPVSGVIVALEAQWLDNNVRGGGDGQLKTMTRPGGPTIGASNQNGELIVPAAVIFAPKQVDETRTPIFVLNGQRRLGEILDVKPGQMNGPPVRVTLRPLTVVRAKVDSPDMEGEGHVMKKVTAIAYAPTGLGQARRAIARCSSENERFGLLLPPGSFDVSISAVAIDNATYEGVRERIDVPADGKGPIDLETIHLPSSRLSELLGEAAPELDGVIEWRNGSALTMADLRGKVVVLEFWSFACSICIAEMPNLFTLQQRHSNNPDLVIIAVHAPMADTLDEAYSKCVAMRQRFWGGREPPFRVALDGGGEKGVMVRYGVRGVPTTLLVDRDGKLFKRYWHPGVPGFSQDVDRLLRTRPTPQPATRRETSTSRKPSK